MFFDTSQRANTRKAFTFVEAIFTIAIIGIMSALALTAISNGTKDANRIVSRQQQATIQEALNGWVMSQSRVGNTAQIQSLSNIQKTYNQLTTTEARFNLLIPNPTSTNPSQREGYLDKSTSDHFLAHRVSSDRLNSAALNGIKSYLVLSNWTTGSTPMVELVTTP